MKTLFLDLSLSEDFSGNKYGGISKTFATLQRHLPNSYLGGAAHSFENYNIDNKIIINNKEEIPYGDFDLILHAQTNTHLKTNKPVLVWAPGQNETIHPENTNLLLHNKNTQNPLISNPETKIHEFVLGIEIPEFQEYKKEDLIVQISNHYPQIGSHILAGLCDKYKINCVFAGPVAGDYREQFFQSVDTNQYTYYIGEISESEKISWLKRAKYYGNLLLHHINEPQLGVKQALSFGCGIIATSVPAMTGLIRNGYNGFLISTEMDFVRMFGDIKQKNCWDSVQKYSIANMTESFKIAAEEVING